MSVCALAETTAEDDSGKIFPMMIAPVVHRCVRPLSSISASPTACPLRGSGRAGTQNDRPRYPRNGHVVGDADIERGLSPNDDRASRASVRTGMRADMRTDTCADMCLDVHADIARTVAFLWRGRAHPYT